MRKQNGFTLVELLVVISIISLLIAILLPALARAKQQARTVACQHNLNQWRHSFGMYTRDNDGFFASGSTGKMWTTFLKPYYEDQELHLCPTATKPASEASGILNMPGSKDLAWGKFGHEFAYWELEGIYGSYGMNGHVSNDPPGAVDPYGRDLTRNWRNADISGAYNIPLFMDCAYIGTLPEPDNAPPQYDGELILTELGIVTDIKLPCIDRHKEKINMLFVDWSVREIGLKQLWTLKWHKKWELGTGGEYSPSPWTKAGGVQTRDWPEWMRHFKDY